uniref:Uncharacterized protein LOC111136382 isoform X9 n=1 Tax=Crassostrea virginica TaxID=6565 RepID=A0A8B8ESG9_CRAVI|nr:uncharacterized protein LOC111136382 isoform X9 [Crassostrea virginica]
MENEYSCLNAASGNGRKTLENCPKCKLLHRQYCICVCLMCAIFASINIVTLIYIIGSKDANSDSDILSQLHVLQARIQSLESRNSGILSGATGTQKEFVELGTAERIPESPWKGIWRGSREKRSPKKKKNKPVKIRHKSCCKPKFTGLQVVGCEEEHRPKGIFHKWQYADWFFNNKMRSRQFELNFENGQLTVIQPGLYLLYSQITLKGNGTQGYHVMRNNQDALLACYSNNLMLQDDNKTSCFTMGVFKLEKNDQISIKHVSTSGIRAVFTSNASFFGLVRLGKFNKRGVVTSV